jgi:hypothetical protein
LPPLHPPFFPPFLLPDFFPPPHLEYIAICITTLKIDPIARGEKTTGSELEGALYYVLYVNKRECNMFELFRPLIYILHYFILINNIIKKF